ncbi:hypothetical protein C1646_775624 [Rhizophagus diaphanus]|nr:hypothetical protein C1646_775624 [Rhizophagus diaphanus] [Rhizophagus sp. MUCL 43196]
METYEITFKEKIPLYYSSQEIFSEETEEEFDTSFDKLSELEIFEFNERNYINKNYNTFTKQLQNPEQTMKLDVKIIYEKYGENISKFHMLDSIHVMYTTFPDQITVASIKRFKNCFSDKILRIEAIFLQDVILVQKSNKVERRKLGITRWKPTNQKKKIQLATSSNI